MNEGPALERDADLAAKPVRGPFAGLRIGMSARLLHEPPKEMGFRGKTLQYLEQSAAHWAMSTGALVFMVPTVESGGDIQRRNISVRRYVAALDGLILQGGADVSPQSYHETPLRPEWKGDRVRDLYELELVWEFIAQGKPVLGICRGAQLINVALGGSLYQDLPTQRPSDQMHLDLDRYDTLHHEIEFVAGSRLQALYDGQTNLRVTSIHHQAVKQLGNDLIAEAQAPDGLVEAIRWRGASYVVGFQWHPEFHRDKPDLLDSTPILHEFLEAAQARAARAQRTD